MSLKCPKKCIALFKNLYSNPLSASKNLEYEKL